MTLWTYRRVLLGALLLSAPTLYGAPAADISEFFEKEVRPLLATHCYSCHSQKAKPLFANLRLDSRAGLEQGSDSGPVVIPGKPAGSRLIQAVKGQLPAKMPPGGSLKPEQIAALERWVEMGAPWPEETAAAPSETSPLAFDLEQRRQEHWAWHPVQRTKPPSVKAANWPANEIDRFLLSRLEREGLQPASDASRATLLRRLNFDLAGLPPTPEEIAAFNNDRSPDAWTKQVDRLLDSPRFGERWARHWMDLVRYSESHGSEGDPDVPEAWRYRDYLIRALNQDIPYDQLVREHLAGDLLPAPRYDSAKQINESVIGIGHFRMVEHGFQPVDPWEDRVKWTDNQIDVFSKAFQGLTVSCARCHDHKFDAISQKDFYALFSTFAGARPTQVAIDHPERLNLHKRELAALKQEIRGALTEAWKPAASQLATRLLDPLIASELGAEACDPSSPLYPLFVLRNAPAGKAAREWSRVAEESSGRRVRNLEFNQQFDVRWNLANSEDYSPWIRHGTAAPPEPSRPGEFSISPEGDRLLEGVRAAGVYSDRISSKHNAVISSPRFRIENESISLRVSGGGLSFAQLIIENYAVPRAGIYALRHSPKQDQAEWVRWDTKFWKGFTGYIEFATAGDVTHFTLDVEDSRKKPRPEPDPEGRSWFGAHAIAFHDGAETPREDPLALQLILDSDSASPDSVEALAERMAEIAVEAVAAFEQNRMSTAQAEYLDFLVRRDLLPARLGDMPDSLRQLVERYRALEKEIPVPMRAPGLAEEASPPMPLLVRGNHKNPGEPVPARFLTALGGDAFPSPASARLALAEQVASPDNPFTARVYVNRLWSHVFGAGLVRTLDNFGKLGGAPSHPELLDWLAGRFMEDGWSTKKILRRMLLTRAYRMESAPTPEAAAKDPENRLLSHMPLKRLEAEALRDAVLAVSGRLDTRMYGPSAPVYYAHETGQTKGDKPKGPMDGDGRRSIYLEVRRNATNPLLEVFDFPKPSTTRGERDLTNVPAQSLALLNSPFIRQQSEFWADRLVAEKDASPQIRIRRMFLRALGREPSAGEVNHTYQFLLDLQKEHQVPQERLLDDPRLWRDIAHALFNLKEFLFIA